MTHNLKCWPEYYEASESGAKPFEFRVFDRPYKVNDYVLLEEFNPKTQSFTGRSMLQKITYLLDLGSMPGDIGALLKGYVVLGFGMIQKAGGDGIGQ